MERRIVEIDDGVWIYLPHGLTPEKETKVIAHYLFNFEPEASEAKGRELLRQHVGLTDGPVAAIIAELQRLA